MRIAFAGADVLAERLAPDPRVDRREVRVAVDLGFDMGDVERVGQRQRQRVDLAAADDEDLVWRFGVRFVRIGLEPTAMAPSDCQSRSRVITMFKRPGSTLGSDSNVLRPMMTGWPSVSALKRLRSVDRRHGMSLSRPITPFSATAAMIAMVGVFVIGGVAR